MQIEIDLASIGKVHDDVDAARLAAAILSPDGRLARSVPCLYGRQQLKEALLRRPVISEGYSYLDMSQQLLRDGNIIDAEALGSSITCALRKLERTSLRQGRVLCFLPGPYGFELVPPSSWACSTPIHDAQRARDSRFVITADLPDDLTVASAVAGPARSPSDMQMDDSNVLDAAADANIQDSVGASAHVRGDHLGTTDPAPSGNGRGMAADATRSTTENADVSVPARVDPATVPDQMKPKLGRPKGSGSLWKWDEPVAMDAIGMFKRGVATSLTDALNRLSEKAPERFKGGGLIENRIKRIRQVAFKLPAGRDLYK